jgi:hypothetical protein
MHTASVLRGGFIIGTGRCGTTLAAQILNAHSQICVPPELQIAFEYSGNGRRLSEIFAAETQLQYRAEDFVREIERMCPHRVQHYFDLSGFFADYVYPVRNLGKLLADLYAAIAQSQDKQIFLEQTPWYGQRIDLLKTLFPAARFIHLLRDGRDVALSYARTPWWHKDPVKNLERWAREATKIAADAALFLDPNCYLEVRYEDLVMNAAATVARMTEFLGATFELSQLDPAQHIDYTEFRNFDATGIASPAYARWQQQRNSAVFTDNVFGWRRDDNELFADMSAVAESALVNFGYDT